MTTNRRPTGQPTGGQFAPTEHTDSAAELVNTDFQVAAPAFFTVRTNPMGPTPPYPAALPAAEVSIEFDGGICTYIRVGDDFSATYRTRDDGDGDYVFDGERDDQYDEDGNFGYPDEWSGETIDEYRTWAEHVHNGIDLMAYDVLHQAMSAQVQAALVAQSVRGEE